MTRRLLGFAWLALLLVSLLAFASLSDMQATGPAFVAYLVGVWSALAALRNFRTSRLEAEKESE